MWTQYAPDAMVQGLVRPAVVVENGREIYYKEKGNELGRPLPFLCLYSQFFYSEIVSFTLGSSYLAPQLMQKTYPSCIGAPQS